MHCFKICLRQGSCSCAQIACMFIFMLYLRHINIEISLQYRIKTLCEIRSNIPSHVGWLAERVPPVWHVIVELPIRFNPPLSQWKLHDVLQLIFVFGSQLADTTCVLKGFKVHSWQGRKKETILTPTRAPTRLGRVAEANYVISACFPSHTAKSVRIIVSWNLCILTADIPGSVLGIMGIS